MMKSKFYLSIITIWILLSAGSTVLFSYLANHPGVMLGIEKTKPGSLLLQGREFVQSGNLSEAVNAFTRAKKQFTALYEETQLERHKSYMAEALYSIASAYQIAGVTPEWQKALPIFQEALDLYPEGNHGLWHLSKGIVHEQLQEYDNAVFHFNKVLEWGSGLTILHALYERGRSFLMDMKFDPACEDLYAYIRSLPNMDTLSEEQWLEFAAIKNAHNPKKYFILAAMHRFLQQTQQAKTEIQTYLNYEPADRAALNMQSSILDQPYIEDTGERSLTELLPPQQSVPYVLTSGVLNLFMAEPGTRTLRLTLSSIPKEEQNTIHSENRHDLELPELTILCNGEERSTFFVSDIEPTEYVVQLDVMEGKNIIILKTQPVPILEPLQKIYVHSIFVDP